MTDFSIFIPRINQTFTITDIVNELSCYGIIENIHKYSLNNFENSTSAIVKFKLTIPIDYLKGRTLKEDIIYRESNRLQPFIHWGKFGGWGLVRNLENLILNNFQYVNNDSIIYDGIYAAGL